MKKILLLIDSLCSGGAQRQIVGLAELLHETGYDIFLADYWDIDFYDDYLKSKGLRFRHCATKGKISIVKAIRNLINEEKPDVVISYLNNPSVIASLIKISHSTKPFKLIVSERNTSQSNGLQEKLRFNLFRFANYIVPNSCSQKRFIDKNYHFLSNKIKVITNFLDTHKFSPEGSIFDRKGFRIIVVGRVVAQKNPLKFLEAIALVKNKNPNINFHVDWYGNPHPQSYFEECLSLRDSLQLKDMVDFIPPVKNIEDEYRKSDAFVLPSIFEGFPNVLCEAMSCGLPIAASNVCDNPNILRNGEVGLLFDPYSIEDMAVCIEKLITMPENDLREMKIKSRYVALNNFSQDKFIDSYLELIEN